MQPIHLKYLPGGRHAGSNSNHSPAAQPPQAIGRGTEPASAAASRPASEARSVTLSNAQHTASAVMPCTERHEVVVGTGGLPAQHGL